MKAILDDLGGPIPRVAVALVAAAALTLAATLPVAAADWPAGTPKTDAEVAAWEQLVESRRQAVEQGLRDGKAAESLALAEELVAYVERTQPKGSVARAVTRELAGRAALGAGADGKAEIHFRACVEEAEAAAIADDVGLFWAYFALGELAHGRGRFTEAAAFLARADRIGEVGHRAPQVRVAVLARLFDAVARDAMQAAPLRPLVERRRRLVQGWPGAPWSAHAIVDADEATLALFEGDFARALELAERAWARADGGHAATPAPAEIARCASVVSLARQLSHDFAGAESAIRRAIAVLEEQLGPDAPVLVGYLNRLGIVLGHLGRRPEARVILARGDRLSRLPGAADHGCAVLLASLAELHEQEGDFDAAVAVRREVVALRRRLFGDSHMAVSIALGELGHSLWMRGSLSEALDALNDQLRGYERGHGRDSVTLDVPRLHQCQVLRELGRIAEAEASCTRADELVRRHLGPHDGRRAPIANALARCALDRGQVDRAAAHLRVALAARETVIARLLRSGTDEDRHQMLSDAAADLHDALALAVDVAPGHAGAAEVALEAVLSRKGRILDALVGQQRRLRDLPAHLRAPAESAARLRAIIAARAAQQLPEDSTAVGRLAAVERDLASGLAAIPALAGQTLLPAVRRALPAGAVLVEYATYLPWLPPSAGAPALHVRRGGRRMGVALLRRDGPVQWLDLGDAATLDSDVDAWRSALADPRDARVDALGRKVDAAIWQPVRARLKPGEVAMVAPDGLLHLVPFAALVDERGRYAAQTRPIVRLSAGRDLLRLALPGPSAGPPLVFANPAFDAEQAGAPRPAGARSRATGLARFDPLPGAEAEGRAVAAEWPGSRLRVGAEATKASLAGSDAPGILHLSTHGFFLPEGAGRQNPLLQSGLALAGANVPGPRGAHGLLTALEVASLDLGATQLVVLSACETGVGRVRSGDGPQGLQRAFGAAGARSVVMSQWQVDDAATRDLMVAFYRALRRGVGRAEALQQAAWRVAQGAAEGPGASRGAVPLGAPDPVGKARWRHPYYWASFQAIGDWRPLPLAAR